MKERPKAGRHETTRFTGFIGSLFGRVADRFVDGVGDVGNICIRAYTVLKMEDLVQSRDL